MRIFLTGASGYLGGALCLRWSAEGHEIRALVRPTSNTAELKSLGVRCLAGDITDRASMREGMSGADWVVHAAAELNPGAAAERMRRVNVEGSRNVASLAWKLGVGRLLYVSSMAAFGGSPDDGSAATEGSPPRLPLPGAYAATKRGGEQAIQECAEWGLRVNTIHPSLVYGPPGKRRGANALLRTVAKGRLPAVIGGDRTTRWIHIDDLVEGIAGLMERAEPGRDFLMTGDLISIDSLVGRVCALAGIAPPRWRISPGAAAALGALLRPLFRLRGWQSPLGREQLASLRRHWNFDDARARRELDWRPRSLEEGLPPAVAFLLGPG